MEALNDFDIRTAFKAQLSKSDLVKIKDEFDLNRGSARVDLIEFGDYIVGYEIKSDKDNLTRLLSQIENYNKALEKVILITGYKHKDKLVEIIPTWWGIIEAKKKGEDITFREIRAPKNNPFFDPSSLLDFLWKKELLDILSGYGVSASLVSKTRYELKNLVKRIATYRELKSYVINLLFLRNSSEPAG